MLIDEIRAGTARQTIVTFPESEQDDITSGIKSGSLKLEDYLTNAGYLKFGSCCSAKFEATIANIEDVTGYRIAVRQQIGSYSTGNLFEGKINSAQEVSAKMYRKIVAYDKLYELSEKNVAEWYDSFWENRSTATIKQFRDGLMSYVGLEQEAVSLINDSQEIPKTVTVTSLLFSDLIFAICQLNAAFGHIVNGKFEYITINMSNSHDYSIRGTESQIEEHTVEKISGVRIQESTDDVGTLAGTDTNVYSIVGNMLTFGMESAKKHTIANNIYQAIKDVTYRPAESIKGTLSDPTIKVGDLIKIQLNGADVYSLVTSNSLSGAMLIQQTIKSEGELSGNDSEANSTAVLNQLKSRVTKVEADTDGIRIEVESISVGGRNYINNSKTLAGEMIIEYLEDESSNQLVDETGAKLFN